MPRRLGIASVVILAAVTGAVLSGHGRYLAEVFGAKPHFVKVTWTASKSPGVTGYNVYRATEPGGPMHKVNRDPIPDSQYTDNDVEAGHTYYYGVTAVNGKNIESARTKPIAITVPKP